ncbi:hypothetical protein RFI_39680, partial [Reticulomyxa filosa]
LTLCFFCFVCNHFFLTFPRDEKNYFCGKTMVLRKKYSFLSHKNWLVFCVLKKGFAQTSGITIISTGSQLDPDGDNWWVDRLKQDSTNCKSKLYKQLLFYKVNENVFISCPQKIASKMGSKKIKKTYNEKKKNFFFC